MEETKIEDSPAPIEQSDCPITPVRSKMPELTPEIDNKAEEVRCSVQNRVDQGSAAAANKSEDLASVVPAQGDDVPAGWTEGQTRLQGASIIRRKAEGFPGREAVGAVTRPAADKVHAAAVYFRQHNAKDMLTDLEIFLRRHPGESILAAAAAGFLVGYALRRKD
jgi:hypothetical protein